MFKIDLTESQYYYYYYAGITMYNMKALSHEATCTTSLHGYRVHQNNHCLTTGGSASYLFQQEGIEDHGGTNETKL